MSTVTETPTITETAKAFFEACETGKGWEGCSAYCHPNASFSAQAEPLADVRTLQEYTEWMKALLVFIPDGRYEVKSFATDQERNSVCAYAVFSGTHSGPAGRCRRPERARARTTSTSWSSKTGRSAT
jgi:predicted ester cyclase